MEKAKNATETLRRDVRVAVMEWIAEQCNAGAEVKPTAIQAAAVLTREALDSMKAAGTVSVYLAVVGPMLAEHGDAVIDQLTAHRGESLQ